MIGLGLSLWPRRAGVSAPAGPWILTTGLWADSGSWDDASNWID